jgi:hypothetical protein
MVNKKGQMEILWLFGILAVVLVLGIVFSMIIGFVHYTSGVITPITEDIGMIGSVNASAVGESTFGVLNTIIGLLPMLVGFAYLMFLIGSIVLVLSYRTTANPLFIGLFFALMILLILGAILGSNAYQDMYTGTDDMALELQSQTMLSFLILQSPMIFGIIGFICGIFLFSGKQNEVSQSGGYSSY